MELFSQGALVREVYWLDEGLIKLVHVEPNGRERILGLRLPPRLVGAALVLLNLPSPVSAVTVTTCCLRRIPAVEFAESLAADPTLSGQVHQMLSQEVYSQFEHLVDLSALSSRVRLQRFLSSLVKSTSARGVDVRVRLPLKRCELAQLLAVTPEHLSRLFRRLCVEGIIGFHKGWLIVRDPERLAAADESPGDRHESDAPLAAGPARTRSRMSSLAAANW